MKQTRLQRCWGRLSLTVRLGLCSGLVLLGCILALLSVILQNAIAEHRTLLHDRLYEEMQSVLAAITEPAVVGDYTAIEQILQVYVRQAVIAQLVWTDNFGHHIQVSGEKVKTHAPWWFGHWMALSELQQTQQLVVGGETYGAVFLRLTPDVSINKLWPGFLQKCGLLISGSSLCLGITLVVLRNGIQPFYALASSARRFGQGDYATRIPLSGPPEAAQCIQAFNDMAENIASLLSSLRQIVEAMPIPVLISRLDDGAILYANCHFNTMVDIRPEETCTHKTSEFYDNPADHQQILKSLAKDGYVSNYELRLKKASGLPFWAVLSLQAIMFEEEHAILTGFYDITKTKSSEEALRHMHDQTVQLLNAISSLLIGVDADTRFTWWNQATDEVLGNISADVIGKPLATCSLPWNSEAIAAGLSTCAATGTPVRVDDIRFQRADGKEGYLGITINPLPGGFLLLGADITERKSLEQQLLQAQKLEAIGQLAAGIAHEINTPTQFIGDNIRFLQEAFGDLCTFLKRYTIVAQAQQPGGIPSHLLDELEAMAETLSIEYLSEEIPTAIAQSLDGIERVSRLVHAMKEFSHPSNEEKTPVDLNQLIESTIIVARNEWKYVAEMVTDFDITMPLVPCFPGAFNQAILNIIVNAAHAIADVTSDSDRSHGRIAIQTSWEPAWATICITDTGSGIPAAIHDKVFDPFFTTKGIGRGTGQGLAIAHDVIVKKHGGRLTFETIVGEGTMFFIRLPLEN